MPEIEDDDDDVEDDDDIIIFPLTDVNGDSGNSSEAERYTILTAFVVFLSIHLLDFSNVIMLTTGT